MYQDGPGPVGRKNVRYVRWNQPLLGSPYNSGGARSPARFAPPRGRGGDRSVPRGCPEPAAPLGPAGGAGSAHPLRTRRLGRGARGGLGLRQGACPYLRPSAGAELSGSIDERAYRRSFSPRRRRKRVCRYTLLRRPQYASSVSPPYIAKSLAREQKARRSRFIATRASRSAARASQLDMLRRKSSFCEKAKPAPEWAIR